MTSGTAPYFDPMSVAEQLGLEPRRPTAGESRVRCPFGCDEGRRSFSASMHIGGEKDGSFYCNKCSTGGHVEQLLDESVRGQLQERRQTSVRKPDRPTNPIDVPTAWDSLGHVSYRFKSHLVRWALNRGWPEDLAEAFAELEDVRWAPTKPIGNNDADRLAYHARSVDRRVMFALRDEAGEVRSVMRRASEHVEDGAPKTMSARSDLCPMSGPRILGSVSGAVESALAGGVLAVVEGEPDFGALAALASMAHGPVAGVVGSPSAKGLPKVVSAVARGLSGSGLRPKILCIPHLGDSDDIGLVQMKRAVVILRNAGCDARIVSLPIDARGKADLAQVIETDGVEALCSVLEEAASHKPPPDDGGGGGEGPDRRRVQLEGDLHDKAQTVLGELHAMNSRRPEVFIRGRQVVRVVPSRGRAQVEDLGARRLRAHVQQEVCFERWDQRAKDLVTCDMNLNIAEHCLSYASLDLPPLERIARQPVFGPDGEVLVDEGYHPALQAWLDLGDFEPLEVPERPTRAQVDEALDFICCELLADFPFVDEASRTHAVCLGLLPFVRSMIDGTTPLYLVMAPLPRVGKTKLVNAVALAITGAWPSLCPPSKDNEEWRKQITATLHEAPTLVLIDNLDPKVNTDSANLASLLTTTQWTARELGSARNVTLSNEAAWVATGNNITLSRELADRSVWIHLDPKVPDPSSRHGFKHDPIEPWAKAQRAQATWAFMVLVRWWIAEGQKLSGARMGGFESWAAVMGGICESVGLPGFLGNRDALRRRVDSGGEEWSAFIAAWWSEHASVPTGLPQLYNLCEDGELLEDIRGAGNERSQRIKLGRALRGAADRIFEVEEEEDTPARLVRLVSAGTNKRSKAKIYKLEVVT